MVGVSTSNGEDVEFELAVERVDRFVVGLNDNVTVDVSVSQPRYFKFEFPEGVSNVLLAVESPDDICMSVSVQNLKVGRVFHRFLLLFIFSRMPYLMAIDFSFHSNWLVFFLGLTVRSGSASIINGYWLGWTTVFFFFAGSDNFFCVHVLEHVVPCTGHGSWPQVRGHLADGDEQDGHEHQREYSASCTAVRFLWKVGSVKRIFMWPSFSWFDRKRFLSIGTRPLFRSGWTRSYQFWWIIDRIRVWEASRFWLDFAFSLNYGVWWLSVGGNSHTDNCGVRLCSCQGLQRCPLFSDVGCRSSFRRGNVSRRVSSWCSWSRPTTTSAPACGGRPPTRSPAARGRPTAPKRCASPFAKRWASFLF